MLAMDFSLNEFFEAEHSWLRTMNVGVQTCGTTILSGRHPGRRLLGFGELLHAHRTLLEVRLARNGIEGSKRDQVGVGFRKMKRHENLPGGYDARNAQLHIPDRTSPGNDGYAIM